jgi:hypothetical protein
LIFEIRLLRPPGTAPEGRALMSEIRELSTPDGSAAPFVGSALMPDTTLPRSDTAPPLGRAPTCDNNEFARSDGSAVAAIPEGRTPDGKTPDGRALTCERSELITGAGAFVGKALISDIKLLRAGTAPPEGSAPMLESNELNTPVGSAESAGFVGTARSSETTDPTPEIAPEGSALSCEAKELSAAGLVGRALMSEIKLLIGTAETTFEGIALICDIRELTRPEGRRGAFVGSALTSEIRLLIPETPVGRALI